MKNAPAKPCYPSGASVKPGDLVTGCIDAGSFPAEPFLAQVVYVAAGLGMAEVVFLKRPGPLNTAASLFRRQSRVAETYSDAMVPVCGLTLRQRCSRPASRHAAEKMAGAHSRAGTDCPSGSAFNAG